jgi:hypothetical protein
MTTFANFKTEISSWFIDQFKNRNKDILKVDSGETRTVQHLKIIRGRDVC